MQKYLFFSKPTSFFVFNLQRESFFLFECYLSDKAKVSSYRHNKQEYNNRFDQATGDFLHHIEGYDECQK